MRSNLVGTTHRAGLGSLMHLGINVQLGSQKLLEAFASLSLVSGCFALGSLGSGGYAGTSRLVPF